MTDGASPAVQTIFALNSKQNVRNLLKSRLNKNFTLNDAEDLLIKWRKEFLKVLSPFYLERNWIYMWRFIRLSTLLK